MLSVPRHVKMGEDQDEDEDIVHAERVLDEIAGEEIETVIRSFDAPDKKSEAKRHQHPQRRSLSRRLHAQLARPQFESVKIDCDRDEHANVECDPKPNARRHREESFMLRGAEQWEIAPTAHPNYMSRGIYSVP